MPERQETHSPTPPLVETEHNQFEYLDYRIDKFDINPNTPFHPLNIVIIGKGPLAEGYLKSVKDAGHNIVSVFGPAKQESDKDFDMVRKTAKEIGIPDHMFSKLNDEKVVEELKNSKPDLIIGASLTAMLPDKIAELALLGAYGWHPSPLPEYRGASAVAWQILNEEEEFGMSLNAFGRDDEMIISDKPLTRQKPLPIGTVENDKSDCLDKGPLLAIKMVPRKDTFRTTSASFPNILFPAGIEFLVETTNKMAIAKDMGLIFRGEPQIDGAGSYQKPIEKKHVQIDWSKSAKSINAIIEAGSFNPGSWTLDENGNMVTLYDSSAIEGESSQPGKLVDIVELEEGKGHILIETGEGLIQASTLRGGKMDGNREIKGKPTPAPQFAKDNNLSVGHKFI